MNIVLWILQVVVAIFCISGSTWRFFNYEQAAQDVASMKALPYWVWNAIGAFEILCALALILPGVLRMGHTITGYAASALAIELLLVSSLHIKHFGFEIKATNPATWTLGLCFMCVIIAYGRLRT